MQILKQLWRGRWAKIAAVAVVTLSLIPLTHAANTFDVFFRLPNNATVLFKPSNVGLYAGAGAPTNTAKVGSVYFRTDGGAGTSLYVNEAGTSTWQSINTTGILAGLFTPDLVASNTLAGAAALTLTTGKNYFPVASTGGAVTACTIPNGSAGQVIELVGTSNTLTVAFTTNGASNIVSAIGTTSRVLALGDTWTLVWDSVKTKWNEIAFNTATNGNPITVAGGGTGLATLTAHSVQVGEGTSAPAQVGVGATGTVMVGATGADPSFSATPTVTSITGAYIHGAQTVQTVATGAAIVMTAGKSFYPVVGAGATQTGVTIPTSAIATGTVITLEGTDATNSVRVDDNAGAEKLSGNITLALHDTLTVVFDGTNWDEVSHSTNG